MTQSGSVSEFSHDQAFAKVEASGNLRLGRLEAMYEELFAEVLEDGVITADERRQLDKMADNLGLDRDRLRRLEGAFQAAYEARNRMTVRELGNGGELPPPMSVSQPRPSVAPFALPDDLRTQALERRVGYLETLVRDLEKQLEEARAQVNVEVDLSDFGDGATATAAPEDDPLELQRRVRRDPRDTESLHALFRGWGRTQEIDRQYLCAQVLAYIGAATPAQAKFLADRATVGLLRPTAPVSPDAWRKLLFHPEEEPIVGDVFAVVASAVLMGRLSAMRRDKALPKLDESKKQDPATSTLQAVRCLSWGAAILGMNPPTLYTEPTAPGAVDVVLALPPVSRLGKQALSGRTARELAFLAGRHLAQLREEHFVKTVFTDVKGLEDVFLASLCVANPGMPLNQKVKELVLPIARAIEPLLEPTHIDRLRGHFLRFVEEGGRTNLQRWSQSVEFTCNRAGLLLAGDLTAAHAMLELEDPRHLVRNMDDLLEFTLSDRYARLRKQLGVAVT